MKKKFIYKNNIIIAYIYPSKKKIAIKTLSKNGSYKSFSSEKFNTVEEFNQELEELEKMEKDVKS